MQESALYKSVINLEIKKQEDQNSSYVSKFLDCSDVYNISYSNSLKTDLRPTKVDVYKYSSSFMQVEELKEDKGIVIQDMETVNNKLENLSLAEMGFTCKTCTITNWDSYSQCPRTNVFAWLRQMAIQGYQPDVLVRIGRVNFTCHWLVLRCYSSFFADYKDEYTIPADKLSPRAFKMVYEWILAEKRLFKRKGIVELYKAASFLQIKELEIQLWEVFDNRYFSEYNAYQIFEEAGRFNVDVLQQLMLTRITKFFLTLVASKNFLKLTAKEIAAILNSNSVGVNSEIEMFFAAIRWLDYDWKKREADMPKLMECVRYEILPPYFIVKLHQELDCEAVKRVVGRPEVKETMSNGIAYHTALLYNAEKKQFVRRICGQRRSAIRQRQWIFDKHCEYHFRQDQSEMKDVSYKDFLNYMKLIRELVKVNLHLPEISRKSNNILCYCLQ